ncbi:MAG TPA: aldo/keto reductase [Gaiellaceae bacterium]|nr:aldo/keto reductase [Gaiellaceae bacterium]
MQDETEEEDAMAVTAEIRLGDVEVRRIGLGTNRLRNTPANVAFLKAAIAGGLGHLDTAHTYTGGDSEETIGAALAPFPDGVVVATKGGWSSGRRDALRAEIEESLRRLRTDVIPLYYLHRPDPETPIEDSVAAIEEYRRSGQIRHMGLSNVGIDEIERARQVAPIVAVQNHYNLAERGSDDVVDYCTDAGIVFVPYFPLRDDGGRPLVEIAARHGATPAQIALAWLLRRSPAMLPIPGTLSADHLRENLAAVQFELDDADLQELDGAGGHGA